MITLKLRSSAEKVRGCAATYLPLATCEGNGCPFAKGGGCFAEWSKVSFTIARTESALEGRDPHAVEAAEIIEASRDWKGLVRGTPLRLRIAGDSRDATDVALTSDAEQVWRAAGGGPVWTYSHAWRKIARKAWGNIAVLASVERPEDVPAAIAAGYMPALVCLDARRSRARLAAMGIKAVQCPGESRGVTCQNCKLCWRANRSTGPVVLFTAHGSAVGIRAARRTLERLNPCDAK